MVLTLIRALIRSPAVHFALFGWITFAVVGGDPVATRADGIRSTISLGRVELVYEQIAREKGRQITAQEKSAAIEIILNREALFLYSREIGLDRDPVVQRRLSQIATFVAENPEETMTEGARVREAVELGLIESDSIIRRILVDGARRLIRATALVREPNEESMARHLNENPDDYQVPKRTRITHVALNRNLRGEATLGAADEMLERLVAGSVSPEEGAALGDETVVEAVLPSMTDRALERRFGPSFVEALAGIPAGSWHGPFRSPLGDHLVFVHERTPQRRARLEEVRERVSSAIRDQVADLVLEARVAELRKHYDLRVGERDES